MNEYTDSLAVEKSAFTEQLPQLIHRGKIGQFALFVGAICIGVFSSYREALVVGYSKNELGSFLVREITETEKIICVA